MGVTRWTKEEDERVIALWNDGHSASIIAALIGNDKSRNAVIGRLHRLGKSGNRPTIARRSTYPGKKRKRKLKPRVYYKPKSPVAKLLAEPFTPRPVPVIPEHERKSLIDLEDGDCRWPCTDGPPHAFCARKKVPGLPYCPDHARAAYSAPQPRTAPRNRPNSPFHRSPDPLARIYVADPRTLEVAE